MSDKNNTGGGRWSFRRQSGQQQQPKTQQPGSSSSSSSGPKPAEATTSSTAATAAAADSASTSPTRRSRTTPTQKTPTTAAAPPADADPSPNATTPAAPSATNQNSHNRKADATHSLKADRDIPTPIPDLSNLRRVRTLQGNGLFGHNTDNVRRSTTSSSQNTKQHGVGSSMSGSSSSGSGSRSDQQQQQQQQHQTLYPDPNVPSVRHFLVDDVPPSLTSSKGGSLFTSSPSASAIPASASASTSASSSDAATIPAAVVTAIPPVEHGTSLLANNSHNNNHGLQQQQQQQQQNSEDGDAASLSPVFAGQRKPDMDEESFNVPTPPGRRRGVQTGSDSGRRQRQAAVPGTAAAASASAIPSTPNLAFATPPDGNKATAAAPRAPVSQRARVHNVPLTTVTPATPAARTATATTTPPAADSASTGTAQRQLQSQQSQQQQQAPLFGRPSNKRQSLEDELPGNKLPPLDDDDSQAPRTLRPAMMDAPTLLPSKSKAPPTAWAAATASALVIAPAPISAGAVVRARKSPTAAGRTDAAPQGVRSSTTPALASTPTDSHTGAGASIPNHGSNPLEGRASRPPSSLIDDDDDDDDQRELHRKAGRGLQGHSRRHSQPSSASQPFGNTAGEQSRSPRQLEGRRASAVSSTGSGSAVLEPEAPSIPGVLSSASAPEHYPYQQSSSRSLSSADSEDRKPAAAPSLLNESSSSLIAEDLPTPYWNSGSNGNPSSQHENKMSEEELFEAAIAASEEEHLNREQIEQSVALQSDQIEDAKENARTLRSLCRNEDVEMTVVETVLDLCRADQKAIQATFENAMTSGSGVDLGELISLNELLLDAIALGEETAKHCQKKEPPTSLEIVALVETKDVFSLICLLRAQQNQRRLDATLALMRFARDAEQVGGKENLRLRDEIRSSGGMHSLLTLFRTGGTVYELKVFASLALAYVLPSFVQSSHHTPPTLGLKIMECLRFLSASRPVSARGETVTSEEAFKASAMGLTSFWVNQLEPMLHSGRSKEENGSDGLSDTSERNIAVTPSQSLRRSSGLNFFDQPHEAIELQELLEMTVSLIIHIAKRSDSEYVSLQEGDSVFTWRYALVEQVCAVEVARPIAVREGILRVLVDWIKSRDREKIRPAVSALRYLTTITDKYMAGWIHSQMVNEGALQGILALTDDYSVGQDVKLAIAQILSALCVAPHTRAAVAEANCINYLIGFLYEHSDQSSQEVALFAGSALTQLAAGAITRASVFGGNDMEMLDFIPPDKRDTLVDDIVNSGAVGTFTSIAQKHQGKLRTVAVGAIRVLSEDISPKRQTRLQLCEDGAAKALGITLRDDVGMLCMVLQGGDNVMLLPDDSLKELHDALCALANILDPVQEDSLPALIHRISETKDPKQLLIRGCLEMTETGGLESLLWIASLPFSLSSNTSAHRNPKTELLEEACRSLASMSPLLLSDDVASKGFARWADDVLSTLYSVLKRLVAVKDKETLVGAGIELHTNLLKGIGAMAKSEPLKVRIVDKVLPYLVEARSVRDRIEISNAASQAFQSLAFAEDEIFQVAGNNTNLLADWFCLKRSLLIQAMTRTEIRLFLLDSWNCPFLEANGGENARKHSSSNGGENARKHSSSNGGENARKHSSLKEQSEINTGSAAVMELFDNFADDEDTIQRRESLLRQYCDIYAGRQSQAPPLFPTRQNKSEINLQQDDDGLLSRQMYPLNDSRTETDWILSHQQSLASAQQNDGKGTQGMPTHIVKFLSYCFPSRLLRDQVIPIHDLRPYNSFNFRALMMPQRRYFSFRREGQLLSRLCEQEAAIIDTSDVHWTLAFTNSTFAGEFVESLVQTLYLCPMITGLSFSKNKEWSSVCDSDKDNEGNEGGALLANLVGSLPPWISYLTFEGLLDSRNLETLVAILETVGKLSSGHEPQQSSSRSNVPGREQGRRSAFDQQTQGKFSFFAIRGSPKLLSDTWKSFLCLLGRVGPSTQGPTNTPLSSLKSLDLSGNHLGDDLCASILELVHDMDAGCSIEGLDLSGNRILTGTSSIKVLRGYVEYYRYNQTTGMKAHRPTWRSPLRTLNLASNGLHMGNAWLEIVMLLKHDALELKVLDLSDNGLSVEDNEYEYIDLLTSTLMKNTVLCQLNLSSNNFNAAATDRIIGNLAGSESGSGLAFLRLENNSPELTKHQSAALLAFTQMSKEMAVQRFLNDNLDDTDTITPLQPIDSSLPSALSSSIRPQGENMITVLFSAPLVFTDERRSLRPFAKLDFDMERELMWQCLKEASRDIELSFDNATHDRLLATIAKRCSCLHYSGHGHQAYLPFEDGSGGPNWFRVQDIKNLIAGEGAVPFRFVFVSACHSGLAGETFASAGVPHVVCCQQESELKDAAALAFTRQFYLALAVGHTVKESFDQGCKAVRATPNLKDAEKEMQKFVLLPREGNHQVPIFNAKPVMEWPRAVIEKPSSKARRSSRSRGVHRSKSIYLGGAKGSELSVRNMMQEDPSPSPPQFFLGREVDMYFVLKAVLGKRLVSVVGESGVGRSSLVCALCHYINERASTILGIDRIYFVKAKQGRRQDRCRALIDQLMRKLVEADKAIAVEPTADLETVFDAVCKSLKYEKALVVFDRMELLEDSDDANDFPMLLGNLFRETRNVKVLLTGRKPLGIPSLGGVVEHPIELGPLTFADTIRLFGNLCPLLHTPADRRKLFESLATDGEEAELHYTDRRLCESTKNIFSILGDGNPSRIEQAAYDVPKDVFESLMNGSIRE